MSPKDSEHSALVQVTAPAPGIRLLTLNNPKARNALSSPMMHALRQALLTASEESQVKVLIITGAPPAFCAGHDLRELRGRGADSPPDIGEIFSLCSRLMLTITEVPQPVIAAVNGIATAAGCQLAATCDLVVAGETARFATPGVNIGLFCSTPMVALTRAVGSKHAMEMLLLGDMVDAATAQSMGLVNRVVPDDAVASEALSLAGKIAAKAGSTLRIGKQAFHRQMGLPLTEAYAKMGAVMAKNMAEADAEEGIDAFLDKRSPVWCS